MSTLKTDARPLFSIVIPNYNGGEFLRDAICSVLNQNCKNFELIVVDGGSSDNSTNIISDYESEITWWVSEKDRGQSDALNKGFSKSKGEFFLWLNSDDVLLPGSLSAAEALIMSERSVKWIAGNTIFIDKMSRVVRCSAGPRWNTFLFSNNTIPVNGPSSIFHHTLLNNYGYFDLSLEYTMDADLWYRFMRAGEKFVRLNHYVWGFRMHEDSKTSHSFNGPPNQPYRQEQKVVQARYNRNNTQKHRKFMFVYKIITGVYMRSVLCTLKNKGKTLVITR